MRSWAMTFAGFGLVAVAAGGTAALVVTRNHAEARERNERADTIAAGTLVEVGKVTAAPTVREVTVPGEVHALVESTIYAKVSGYVKLIHVDKGDRVTAGEILGLIEAPEVQEQVVSKRADVAVKKLTASRYQLLEKSGLLSQQDLDQASANVNIAEADLKQLESLSGYQVIRAPFDGVITARYADPGALLQAATQSQSALPLVTVANMDRVRVQSFLAQGEALFVHPGDRAVVWAPEKADVKADVKVTRLANELDARTRMMLTEIEMDNTKTGFYPGSVLRVKLSLAMPEALSVPSDAIVESAGKFLVVAVDGERAHYVPVEVVDTTGTDTRVRTTLKVGDQIVRHPSDDVADGSRIRIAQPRK